MFVADVPTEHPNLSVRGSTTSAARRAVLVLAARSGAGRHRARVVVWVISVVARSRLAGRDHGRSFGKLFGAMGTRPWERWWRLAA